MTEEKAKRLDNIMLQLRSKKSISDIEFKNSVEQFNITNELLERQFIQQVNNPMGKRYTDHFITESGANFSATGGFLKEYESYIHYNEDRKLDRSSKKWAIINAKWSLGLSIVAIVISIIALLKDLLMELFK
ncbi:hypothetical protein [Sphingobacterium multivorum]|uniref:hypothetical protein n=1 Tax=Sphingobacterium multivorum TaxID=28454 RepID=UPI0031BB7B8E